MTEGIPGGNPDWIEYYSDLTGVREPPKGFDPKVYFVPPVARERIRFIKEENVIDLGNRQFEIMISRGHTEDSIILYDSKNKVLFAKDVFSPYFFYFMNL